MEVEKHASTGFHCGRIYGHVCFVKACLNALMERRQSHFVTKNSQCEYVIVRTQS
jgi:hypothetical protein